MRIRSSRRSIVGLVVGLLGAGIACDKTPTRPSGTVVAIKIDGPSVVNAGEAQQYTATATYDDGTTRDVTQSVTWGLGNSAGISISHGRVTWKAAGDVYVLAVIGDVETHFPVTVVVAGTFRISGTVTDARLGTPLADATVIVTAGHLTNLHARSDAGGHFELNQMVGAEEVTVSKDGFTPQTKTVMVSDLTTLDFALVTADAADISGEWTLRLSASTSCRDRLPASARDRQYKATIVQTGSQFVMTLSALNIVDVDPSNRTTGSFRVKGVIIGQSLHFTIEGVDDEVNHYYSPFLFERMTATETYGAVGSVEAALTGDDIAGIMDQSIDYWATPYPVTAAPTVECMADNHVILLTRSSGTAQQRRPR